MSTGVPGEHGAPIGGALPGRATHGGGRARALRCSRRETCARPRHGCSGTEGSEVDTPPHRETGRARAAQFALSAVYVLTGGATRYGGKGAQGGDRRSAVT